ncbi:MAG: dolichyl-phosphate-mannose--protein mannosyltransferase [Lachnospiraceae bacterium]|nr:dolichyl-phosphate-mannose--protein mannosyltransferase [Lachnospiraceae bacterium]
MVFLAEWGLGILLGFRGVLLGDAMSRTANSFYVLNSIPHRLSSMGLVWNPLPSILQLPFVWAAKLWRPLVTKGISMSFVSALFTAWGARALYNCFHSVGCPEKDSLIVILLYSLNPYVLFYGANGMTEIMMGAAGIQVIASLTNWMLKGKPYYIIEMGMSFVIMFLVRYEAVPFAIFIALGMALHMIVSRHERQYYIKKGAEPLWYIESTMWVTFLPLIFTVICWVIYNWMITGNPLFFMNSGYSMSAYSAYYQDYGSALSAFVFVLERVWPALIPFLALLIARFVSGQFLRYETLIMGIAIPGLTVFTTIMILLGKSGGYVRYLCYPLFFAPAFVPYAYHSAGDKGKKVTRIMAAGLLLTGIVYAWAFRNSSLFREDLLLGIPAHSESVADYLNANCRNSRVLMDSYRTYYVIMNADEPERWVISCSPDFDDCVADPVHTGVDYIVVPQIGSYGNMDALNIAWPELYNNGCDWAEEVTGIGEFKIFRVKR